MRTRMRPAMSEAQLKDMYKKPHDHTAWEDHWLRVDTSISVAKWLMRDKMHYTVADLSTGNGAIPIALMQNASATLMVLGDYAPGHEYVGPIEETIQRIPHVDLFILSETIEHLNDPDGVLAEIRPRADRLLLSTPIDERFNDGNPQHYWSWGTHDIESMLASSGWHPATSVELKFAKYAYDFQIWGCS